MEHLDYLTSEEDTSAFDLRSMQIERIVAVAKAASDAFEVDVEETETERHKRLHSACSALGETMEPWWNIEDDWDSFWEDEDIKAELLRFSEAGTLSDEITISSRPLTHEQVCETLAAARLFYREFFLEREYATRESQEAAKKRLSAVLG